MSLCPSPHTPPPPPPLFLVLFFWYHPEFHPYEDVAEWEGSEEVRGGGVPWNYGMGGAMGAVLSSLTPPPRPTPPPPPPPQLTLPDLRITAQGELV